MSFFEISKADISKLDEGDLRELVARLCEAEIRHAAASTRSVLWGGSQTAPDGGLDVEVILESAAGHANFVPRPHTGFQVKKSSMPQSEIRKEMLKNGQIRPVIIQLAKDAGAYIIVSSGDDCSSLYLNDRLHAMRDAIKLIPNCEHLCTDFYDRSRLATWLRSHPGVTLWVRDKLSRPLNGWHCFGRWTGTPKDTDDSFIVEDELRLKEIAASHHNDLPIMDGIRVLRDRLRIPGKAIRLTGLSGVGKTRLIQALFEDQVGERALAPTTAVYADLGETLDPSARETLSMLSAEGHEAILILDNCPPDIHRQLTKQLRMTDSRTSLLTVEYDVGDDQPEETDVFLLEPSGKRLIEEIVTRRFTHLSRVDARTIADLSDGNARLAIALASTVESGQSVSIFSDTELFNRLFAQRQGTDLDLLRSAEALALVYSFNSRLSGSEDDELAVIGTLVNKDADQMFAASATLLERHLAQKRGRWRAILPHALANKLAKSALRKISIRTLFSTFVENNRERLLVSFSHRLSFLHDSEEAREIVAGWLAEDGILGDVSNLSAIDLSVLEHSMAVDPDGALAAIERAARGPHANEFACRRHEQFSRFVDLLLLLAYQAEHFERASHLLIQYARTEEIDENRDSIARRVGNLFQLYLSGTHALPAQRSTVIRYLLNSGVERDRELAFEFLDAALKTHHWTSSSTFNLGARSRNFGYEPRTTREQHEWYSQFINLAIPFALSKNDALRSGVRRVLADNLRGLWTRMQLHDELEQLAMQLHADGGWIDGWHSVRSIIQFHGQALPSEVRKRLEQLAQNLRPTDLASEIRAYVLRPSWKVSAGDCDAQSEENRLRWVVGRARELGCLVAGSIEVLGDIGDDLFTVRLSSSYSFGHGLADGTSDHDVVWNFLIRRFILLDDAVNDFGVLTGYLNWIAEKDCPLAEKYLDEALAIPECRSIFVALQIAVSLNKQGFSRILRLLQFDDIPAGQFRQLGYACVEDLFDSEVAQILELLSNKPDGARVGLSVLRGICHDRRERDVPLSEELAVSARHLLIKALSSDSLERDASLDYEMASVASVSLRGSIPVETAEALAAAVGAALASGRIDTWDHRDTFRTIACRLPHQMLDCLIYHPAIPNYKPIHMFDETFGDNILSDIASGALVDWCNIDPERRFADVAHAIFPFSGGRALEPETGLQEVHLTTQALAVLESAPEPEAILDAYGDSRLPTTWSVPLSQIIARRRGAIEALRSHPELRISRHVPKVVDRLVSLEKKKQEHEKGLDQEGEQTFE